MTNKSSQNDQVFDGSLLLRAVQDSEADLPGVCRYLSTLEQANSRLLVTRGHKESLVAATHEATRQLRADLKTHREAVCAMRNFIMSVLGRRSEKLVRYGIRPVRRRGGILGGLPN